MPYINTALLNLSYEKYKALIILIFVFYCIIKGIFNIYQIESSIFSATLLINLILPYIIGGYIRLFDTEYKKFWKYIGILYFCLTIVMEVIFESMAIYYKDYFYITLQNELSLNINSFILFLCSFGIIWIFKDIEIHNKLINFISTSILGIYLIHANKNIAPFIYNVWYKTNDYNQDSFFVRYLLKTFIIFFTSLFIDIIRRYTIGLIIEYILFFFINLRKKFQNFWK